MSLLHTRLGPDQLTCIVNAGLDGKQKSCGAC